MDDQREGAELGAGEPLLNKGSRLGKVGFFLALPAAAGSLLGILIEPG